MTRLLLAALFATACSSPSPKAQAPKAQAPKAQAPKAQAPKAQSPKAQAPKAQAPPGPDARFTGAEDAEFDRFLPPEVRAPILAGLRRIPFDRAGLDRLPTAHFISAEAAFPSFKNGKRVYVRNKARLVRHDRFDYWILHQTTEEDRFTDTSRFMIVVDKSVTPRMSYYLQFEEDEVGPGVLPRPKGFTTSCFACHPGGPRIVRPQVSTRVASMSDRDRGLVKEWNEIIAGYREVATHVPIPRPSINVQQLPEVDAPMKPPPGYEVPLRELDPVSNAPVTMKACVACHSHGSGVRAPVYAQNAETILTMVHYPIDPDHRPQPIAGTEFMHPFDELKSAALTPFEQDCLVRWLTSLQQPDAAPTAGDCEDPARAAPPRLAPPPPSNPGASLLLDAAHSSLQIRARALFADITVENLGLSGGLKCRSVAPKPGGCGGQLMADLGAATTGIALRDAHLRTYLKIRQLPYVVVQLSDVGWAQVAAGTPLKAEVEVAGRSAPYDVKVRCDAVPEGLRCDLAPFDLRLSRHGLQPYGYLGAVVDDAVRISGRLTLRGAKPG